MKKILLMMMIFGFVTSYAQMQKERNLVKRVQDGYETNTNQQNLPAPVLNTKAVNEDVNRIPVGTCINYRSVRREEPHVISYNAELDVISITFALDPDSYDQVDEGGVIGMFYSTDKGQSWEGPVVVADHTSDGFEDTYMSGIIYNPDGNTNITDAYGVSQGTNTTWNDYTFGSNKLSGDDYYGYMIEVTDPDFENLGYFNQLGLNQYGENVRGVNIYCEGPWSAFTSIGLETMTAEFNNGEFDWTSDDVIDMNLFIDDAGEAYWIGKWVGRDMAAEIAWSKDGETGYMWVLGVSDDEATAAQPIMFSTTDGGDSWDAVEIDFFNDDAQAFFEPYIYEIHTGMMIPSAYESAGVVDANGDLQLFLVARTAAADVINYPDSLGYIYTGDYGHIFNIEISPDGIQEMMWVDSIDTENPGQDAPNYGGSVGWQHRLSAAKSEDEKQVFITWIDSRGETENQANVKPDIFGWSKEVETDQFVESFCFTEGTLYETFYFFTYGADMAYTNGDGGYTIPYFQSVSPGEYSSNAAMDPITVNYVTGIEFPKLPFVGTQELSSINHFKLTQNLPNPFNGTTTINVTTETVAPVMVEISNIMGQTIYTVDAGNVNGTQEITLKSNNMEAGVYFYTVTVGNESITKKMVVK